jgi:hypothetical protein
MSIVDKIIITSNKELLDFLSHEVSNSAQKELKLVNINLNDYNDFWSNLHYKSISVKSCIINACGFPDCTNLKIKNSFIINLCSNEHYSPQKIIFDNCVFGQYSDKPQACYYPTNYKNCKNLIISSCTSYSNIISAIVQCSKDMLIDLRHNDYRFLSSNVISMLHKVSTNVLLPSSKYTLIADKGMINNINLSRLVTKNSLFLTFRDAIINIDKFNFSVSSLTFINCTILNFTNQQTKITSLTYIKCTFANNHSYPFDFSNLMEISMINCAAKDNEIVLNIIRRKESNHFISILIPQKVVDELPLDVEVVDNPVTKIIELKKNVLPNNLFIKVKEPSRTKGIYNINEASVLNQDITKYNRARLLQLYSNDITQALKLTTTMYERKFDYIVSPVIKNVRYYIHSNTAQLAILISLYVKLNFSPEDLLIEDNLGYQYSMYGSMQQILQILFVPNKLILQETFARLVDNNTALRTFPTFDKLTIISESEKEHIKSSLIELSNIKNSFPSLNALASQVHILGNTFYQSISFINLIPIQYNERIVMFGPVILGNILGNVEKEDTLYIAFLSVNNDHKQIVNNYINNFLKIVYPEIEQKSKYSFTIHGQQVVIINKKYQFLSEVVASIALSSDEIIYYNKQYFASQNFMSAILTRSNTVMLEDIHQGYVKRLLRATKKGFRIQVPIDFTVPSNFFHNKIFADTLADIYYAEVNGYYDLTVENTSTTDKYVMGYDKYLGPALGNHEYYNWYNWSYLGGSYNLPSLHK